MCRLEWLGLAILTSLAIWARASAPDERETDRVIGCDFGRTPAQLRLTSPEMRARTLSDADLLYRAGDARGAASEIRLSGAALLGDQEDEPRARLYAQLAEAQDVLSLPQTSGLERVAVLLQAQALDLAVGGAFAERYDAQLRDLRLP